MAHEDHDFDILEYTQFVNALIEQVDSTRFCNVGINLHTRLAISLFSSPPDQMNELQFKHYLLLQV